MRPLANAAYPAMMIPPIANPSAIPTPKPPRRGGESDGRPFSIATSHTAGSSRIHSLHTK